jgi:hypothetical protein
MKNPEITAEPTEPENVMDAWNYLHQKMWEQVELEKWKAERFGTEFTLDHPEKIFGSNALKTPWDGEALPPRENIIPEELQIATVEANMEDVSTMSLSQVVDSLNSLAEFGN